MVKKKRIEAIRSQILSKLRLPKEPEPDQGGDEEEIPTTLLSLYNSTKEILKEQQTEVQTHISTEQEEEEYFSKVLHKFNMTSEYQITRNRNTSVMNCAHIDAHPDQLNPCWTQAHIYRQFGDISCLTQKILEMQVFWKMVILQTLHSQIVKVAQDQ